MTGFGSGNIPSYYDPSGALFVGGSDRVGAPVAANGCAPIA